MHGSTFIAKICENTVMELLDYIKNTRFINKNKILLDKNSAFFIFF